MMSNEGLKENIFDIKMEESNFFYRGKSKVANIIGRKRPINYFFNVKWLDSKM
jgi:hypothetical protein